MSVQHSDLCHEVSSVISGLQSVRAFLFLDARGIKLATTEASSELEPDMGGPNRGAVILPSGNSFYFSTLKIKSNQDRGRALELQSHR
jgi:hypothetical protein